MTFMYRPILPSSVRERCREKTRGRDGPLMHTGPNKGMQATAYSVRCASASRRA